MFKISQSERASCVTALIIRDTSLSVKLEALVPNESFISPTQLCAFIVNGIFHGNEFIFERLTCINNQLRLKKDTSTQCGYCGRSGDTWAKVHCFKR